MIILDLMKLSLKDLRSGGVRSLLVLLSVAVGAASLVAFVSQAEGMRYNVETQFRGLSANVIIGIAGIPTITPQDIIILRSFPHVVDVRGALIADAEVHVAGKRLKFKVVGMDTNTFYEILPSAYPEEGQINLDLPGAGILGSVVYNSTRIGVSGLLPVIIPGAGNKEMTVRIVGILPPQGVNPLALGFDPDKAIFVNLNTFQDVINVRKMNLIYIIADSPKNVQKVFKNVNKYLESKHVQLFAPLSVIKVYMSAVSFAERFLLAMSLMAFAASGFSIANTMMITVIERTKEIGVMKAVGYSSRQVMAYYLLLASMYGLVGGIMGSIIGYLLAGAVSQYMNVIGVGIQQYLMKYFKMNIPSAKVTWNLVLEAIVFSLIISVASGIYPAYKAARLDPVKALKSE